MSITRAQKDETQVELDVLARRIEGVEKKIQRLVDAFAIGALSLDLLQANTKRFEAERNALLQQKAEMEQSIQSEDPERLVKEIRGRVGTIIAAATDPDQEINQRRLALEKIIDSVHVSRKLDACKVMVKL